MATKHISSHTLPFLPAITFCCGSCGARERLLFYYYPPNTRLKKNITYGVPRTRLLLGALCRGVNRCAAAPTLTSLSRCCATPVLVWSLAAFQRTVDTCALPFAHAYWWRLQPSRVRTAATARCRPRNPLFTAALTEGTGRRDLHGAFAFLNGCCALQPNRRRAYSIYDAYYVATWRGVIL